MEGRQPAVDLLGAHGQVTRRGRFRRTAHGLAARSVVPAVVAAVVLAGCTSGEPSTDVPPSGTASSGSPSAASPSDASGAPPPPTTLPASARPPRANACYDLDFAEATSPTNTEKPVSCRRPHTSQTFYVGRLDTVVDGHLLAVDSAQAQAQVREACPRRLARYVGGSARDQRLSRLEAVWFSPTLEQSDQGASWFRCDVVGLSRGSRLADLPGRQLKGLLSRPGALDEVGLCGTAEPGSVGFDRVICSEPHSWRAVTTIDMPGGRPYPGAASLRAAGEDTCRDFVRRASGSPEEFRYGWEWPTREQWRDGQRYGFCWAQD